MAQDREDRVPVPAKVWGLARVETKAAADKAKGPEAVAAAERAVVVGKGKVAPDVEVTGKTDFRVF